MAPASPIRVLLVDDEEGTRGALESLLRADGFEVTGASNGQLALAQAGLAQPDVVLTDLQMPVMSGNELCQRLHVLDPDLPVLVMTGFSDKEAVLESLRVGAEDYLIKPLHFETLVWTVRRAIARRDAKREQEALYRTLNEHLVRSSVREQEHAELEARHRAQLAALLENLQEGVTIADGGGRIQMLNRAGRHILGVGEAELATVEALNRLEALDVVGDRLDDAQRPLVRALRGEAFADQELLVRRPGGELRRLVSTGTSIKDERGEVGLAIVVFRDVTELSRLERLRDEFLALITHDLRNPLASILVLVATLKESAKKKGLAQDVDLAERAERNVKRMNTMLEELTLATTLELQGVALHRERRDLGDLVTAVVSRMDDAAARRITIDVGDEGPHAAFVDASELERVVENLLTNALKYSAKDAPVHVALARAGEDVELRVADRGIGIAPESAKMLFDRYYRTKAGRARASGVGLGLYIARLIVEAHGGRIDVSSEVGRGSVFRMVLPAQSAAG